MPQPSDWAAIARRADPDELREQILTGFRSGKPFTPYVPTIALPRGVDSVLDFGCGIGRNFPYLKTIARHVAGFDLPPMIARCRTLAPVKPDALYDDWNEVRTRRYDLVVTALVLQHVEPPVCREYLIDFARMAPAVYLLSRTESDFGTNVFAEVFATDLFEAGDCVEVDHDPDTHQLRILGTKSFDQVQSSHDSRHYETLLRSRHRRS